MIKKWYKALAKGHDGNRIIEKGETFEFGGKPGKWMKEVKAPAKPAEEKPAEDK